MRGLLTTLFACVMMSPVAAQAPLNIGETFTLASKSVGETRRINVYRPAVADSVPLPVLYMPDGGMAEDFLHVAGLVQVLVGNGSMRPFLLVGVENTERRRDMTGPTSSDEDRKIAPRVGGSAAFRAFFRDELMPEIRRRYRTTAESAIVGESLAGLFVVETLLDDPGLFNTYIAFDPSLWWNSGALVDRAAMTIRMRKAAGRTLFLATSSQAEIAIATTRLANAIRETGLVRLMHATMTGETHATIYHPAALKAFREVFSPPAASPTAR